MSSEDIYPHYGFNFQSIHEHWKSTLGNVEAATKYLRFVSKRLQYWLLELGKWIDFDLAMTHLKEDLHVSDAESRLVWLALRRRVTLANMQRRRLLPGERVKDGDHLHADVPLSSDGIHDKVWHEDFARFYERALTRERRELRKLRETGLMPASKSEAQLKRVQPSEERVPGRPRLQWAWANRLLAYLFVTLRQEKAIYDDGEMWAALEGVFRDRNGKPITRKDMALWAHQYHNNKSCEEGPGKPKEHDRIDQIVKKIRGKDLTGP